MKSFYVPAPGVTKRAYPTRSALAMIEYREWLHGMWHKRTHEPRPVVWQPEYELMEAA